MSIAMPPLRSYAGRNVRKSFIMTLLTMAILLPVVLFSQERYQKVKNAKIPEYDEEGNLKSIVYADMASIPKKAGATKVQIEGLRIEMFKDNEVDVTIEAKSCVYDRKAREATSQDAVKISSAQFDITGSVFEYDGLRQRFTIYENATVKLKDLKNGSAFAPPEESPDAAPTQPVETP